MPEGQIFYSFRTLQALIDQVIQSFPGVESWEKKREESLRIETKKGAISLQLFLILNLKKKVPETAWELQKELKETLEKKTGLRVDRVDIYVQGFAVPQRNNTILTIR
ncbi:MAG TPA: Asp23/Gls24 family envelope stress response protein [Candidatus Atribacteria bacterium]|nr:Asp23/Gls24 family envelope stress response protein [Candidatus Atribacteria bacterium]HPU08407.1 Asp23/Gls24 family envelope stress response protein [Candidatus Atribacteria bacterium]HPZ81166.1 Asp23/Gls24 family envelope stress response protein [Candidatus Atribacteria bacterium]HQE24822.1 Asp23/Gls24 family envelope stress response protein [Candidatus Atribacteria bacterium]